MKAAELIQRVLSSRRLSQTELADLIGVERSFLSRCLRGERLPGRMSCLLMAGFAETSEEKNFWLKHSGVDSRQLTLVRRALTVAEPKPATAMEQALLEWWRHPANPLEESAKELVEKLLQSGFGK